MRSAAVEIPRATMTPGHEPVLLREVLELLAPRAGEPFLDATFGGGGHARALLESAPEVLVLAMDRDPAAQERGAALKAEFPDRLTLVDLDFGRLADRFPRTRPSTASSSTSASRPSSSTIPERGFSFRSDAPADMRLDPRVGVPASRWLETATEEMLIRAVRDLGEDPHWRRVARALMAARGTGALSRTSSLAALIADAIPARDRRLSKIHPATRAFQGIRIAINDELGALDRALAGGLRPAQAGRRPGGHQLPFPRGPPG